MIYCTVKNCISFILIFLIVTEVEEGMNGNRNLTKDARVIQRRILGLVRPQATVIVRPHYYIIMGYIMNFLI